MGCQRASTTQHTAIKHRSKQESILDVMLMTIMLCCAVQPSQVPEFGIRYGIQIGQAFGYDFGLGIVKQICFVSFVIV